MRQRRREREAEEAQRRRDEQAEEAKPLIDLTAEIKPFDESRLKLLLELFSDHFLKMADRSAKHRNHGQSYMYLRSAENLITLVEEMGYQCRESREQVIHLIQPNFLSLGDEAEGEHQLPAVHQGLLDDCIRPPPAWRLDLTSEEPIAQSALPATHPKTPSLSSKLTPKNPKPNRVQEEECQDCVCRCA